MAKLADIDFEIRTLGKFFGVFLGVVILLFLIIKGGQIVKNVFFPSPPPPPEEKFGRLPPVSFPGQNPVNLEYRINTLTGKLPVLPDRVKVYKVAAPPVSLNALKNVRDRMKSIGYDQNETKVNEAVYSWSDKSGSSIQYNILNNSFKITSNVFDNPPTILTGQASTKDGAYDTTKIFVGSLGLTIDDIDPDKTKSTYLKIDNGQLVAASSQNDAQFIRIDLFQKDQDNRSIYFPGLTRSTMYFIYRDEGDIPSIVEAGFFHLPPDNKNFSDYGIKTADQAFSELQKGNAYIALHNPNENPVDITDVALGYYVGADDQTYLLPVIIFSSSSFTAYVNAIPSQ